MAKNMHRYIEYISLFVDCIVLPLCVRLPYMLCSSPWQVSHSSGISNILGSSTQSRLHLHSFTGSHTGIPLTYTWPPHSHNTLRHVGLWDPNSDLHASVARASPRVMANAAYQLYRIRMLFINFTGSGLAWERSLQRHLWGILYIVRFHVGRVSIFTDYLSVLMPRQLVPQEEDSTREQSGSPIL